MKFYQRLFFALAVISCFNLSAQTVQDSIERRIYNTAKIQGEAPTINGKLDDQAWRQVEWATGFTENEPDNNTEASQQTSFKILYDDKYLYVGYRCHDTEPDSIVSRMSRRDGFEGDWVEINIDSYHDLQTAFSFTASVSGVKGDESITNQFNWDSSFNPIWYVKTSIDSEGWIAEIKIPFSQLRFTSEEEQIWGFQVNRRHFRDGSRSTFQHIPNNAPYWVRGFAELHGIRGIKPQKQREIQPYVVGKAETYPTEEGNPFATGRNTKLTAGVDGKIGLTNNMILDFTINPDFGQVEADPSQLRLDGFEVFFREQRPFFVEGSGIFNSRITNFDVWGGFNSDRLFYSRRIGGSPKGSANASSGEYVQSPENSTILGAAKVSGRTQSGLSFGILESVTQEERAIIDNEGVRREEMVEPLTSYFVSRFKQDINDNNTTIGGSFNAVNRNLGDSDMREWLHDQAYTGGIDVLHKWNDQKWQLQGNLSFSQISGTESAILNTQTDFRHSFDRPDAKHLSVDSTATSLFGHAGSAKIARYGGKWRFSTGVTWRSPGLELNDIGFMQNTDEIVHGTWGGFRLQKPKGIFNMVGLNVNQRSTFDFSGAHLGQMYNTNGWFQFKNFWSTNLGVTIETKDLARRALFGGPMLRRPTGMNLNFGIGSDDRKKLSVNAFTEQGFAWQNSVRGSFYGMWIQWQPMNAMSVALNPTYSTFFRKFQSVTNLSHKGATEYIGASLHQETFSLTARLNYNITPDLTIQYYGSPFISHGVYSDFKQITDPMAFYDERFELYGEDLSYEATQALYYFDDNNNGAFDESEDYTEAGFGDPDFSFIQFRSNLVARWEYTPGSELYLVWSQNTTNGGDPMGDLLPTLNQNIFQEQGRNIFLVKWTYRFLL